MAQRPSSVRKGHTTRTQVGRRTYNGFMDKAEAPSMSKNQHHRHENISLVGNASSMREDHSLTNFTQINAMDSQLNNRLRRDPRFTSFTQSNAMTNHPNNRLAENPRVENEYMNDVFEQEDGEGTETHSRIMEKETRGPTYMQSVWGRPSNLPLIHVEYNEFGQPIGGENSTLCHFLGSIARNGKYCPVDLKDWHAMPNTKKKEMLEVVKERFNVPSDDAQKWIISSIGHKWRNWKCELKAKYWADVAIEHLIEERDERVSIDQWVKLLTFWGTEEAKKTSARNQKARQHKIMNQRTGKTSFAKIKATLTKEKGRSPSRVELFKSCFVPSNGNSSVASSKYSAMQALSNELPEGSHDRIAPNDIFSQVMGNDAPGHVRMLGHGICPSDVWSEAPRSASHRLLKEQQETIAHLENMLSIQQRSCPPQINFGQCTPPVNSLPPHATPTLHLQVGMHVLLKSLFNPNKIVAKGYVLNTNPDKEVGGQMLGFNWCEVNVQVIVEPEERLIRPYNNLQVLSQAKGEMIAWPCNLVTPTVE